MKIVSLNIEKNKHFDLIFPFIKKENPEVICFQEVFEDDLEYIKAELGMECVFKVFSFETSRKLYKDEYGKRQGSAIFAKKIIDSGYFFYQGSEECLDTTFEIYLKEEATRSSNALVWAKVVGTDEKTYTYVTTHFPVTTHGESTPEQLAVLPPFFKYLDSLGDFVLCGDFNAPRGKDAFSRIAAKYKDCIPENYVTSIDQNLHRVKGIMFMVDGLFTTKEYQATDVHLVDGLSDHMAIVGTITKVA